MRYESVAVLFFLVLTALLWTDVLCAEVTPQPDDPKGQDLSLNTETVPSPEMSSIWLDLNDDLLSFICQLYGPVRFNASDRQNIGKVLKVLTTLSRLFENLHYVGTIEVDEVLAYYLLLSELSFVMKRYPNELERKLMTWPLPKGNLTLSLLISTGPIRKSTFDLLASYLPYISETAARLDAVNYCLDACAEGSMDFSSSLHRILGSVSDPNVVRELKRILIPSTLTPTFIASGLLHFAPAELDKALVDDIKKGLVNLAPTVYMHEFNSFLLHFIYYPTILRQPGTMQAIFERNALAFRAIPSVSDKQLTILSAVNKIKFGTSFVFTSISKEEWIALFEGFKYVGGFGVWLVFSIWAREDVSAVAWGQFAKDSSNASMLSKLAFDLDRFFVDHFDANLFRDDIFSQLLKSFKYEPNSSKKQQFLALLRAKVQGGPDVVQPMFWDEPPVLNANEGSFRRLLNFFIEQDDKEGLQALRDIIFKEIDGAPLTELAMYLLRIVPICQCLGGGVDGPLGRLAVRVGGAKVLNWLEFSRIRANDLGEMLRTLGISWEKMNAALASLSDTAAPRDELAEVLRVLRNTARRPSLKTLPSYHALWFYLWKEYPEAFVEHMHRNIQRHYLPKKPRRLGAVR